MKKRMSVALPGYVTVAGAAERLRLASRSVRDLVYAGRLPSARLGRRHFLRIPDVEAERRRRLGLPLSPAVPAVRRPPRPQSVTPPRPRSIRAEATVQPRAAAEPVRSEARRERAQQRATELERWLRSGHGSAPPPLPFTVVALGDESTVCDVCRRPVGAGGSMVDAGASDGRAAARLCLPCARRALLAWSDSRRREAVAGRRFARALGATYTPLLESDSAA